jgi:hypothetical protein
MPAPSTPTRRVPQTQRLLVCAHGPTEDLRQARFGGSAVLSHPDPPEPVTEPVTRWLCGPEPACSETLTRWGVEPDPVALLAGPDFGGWAGLTLAQVAEAHPRDLEDWLRDPAHPPSGGESLTALVDRLRPFTADLGAAGWSGVVTTPLVARALVVAALDATGDLVGRIEIGPGGRALLTRPDRESAWRLRRLS